MKSLVLGCAILSLLVASGIWAKPPMDTDKDGIADLTDLCPYTPPQALVNDRGCTQDIDFDGVADGLDICPNSTFGETVNPQGCSREEREAQTASADTASPAPAPPPAPVLEPIASAPAPVAAAEPPAPPAAIAPPPQVEHPAPPPSPLRDNSLPEPPPVFFEEPAAPPPVAPAGVASQPPVSSESPAPAPEAPAAPAGVDAMQQEPVAEIAAPPIAPAQPDETPPDELPPGADSDHAELLPLLHDEEALLNAIDRRIREREAAEQRALQGLPPIPPVRNKPPVAAAVLPPDVSPAQPPAAMAAPPPAKVYLPRNIEHLLLEVAFAPGKAEITASSSDALAALTAQMAARMQADPKLRVEVLGHADPISERSNAVKIGNDRALKVHAYLIGHGIPPRRITRFNREDQSPLVSGGDGLENQRAEIFLYSR